MIKDSCKICNGSKGGIPGNENIIHGILMCDYCHAEQLKKEKFNNWKPRPTT